MVYPVWVIARTIAIAVAIVIVLALRVIWRPNKQLQMCVHLLMRITLLQHYRPANEASRQQHQQQHQARKQPGKEIRLTYDTSARLH